MGNFFVDELEYMEKKYAEDPIRKVKLKRSKCMYKEGLSEDDPNQLAGIFGEIETLVKHGKIYYSVLVGAQKDLYRRFPAIDEPAFILYSKDPEMMTKLQVLEKAADEILEWVNVYEHAPEHVKEAAKAMGTENYHAINMPYKYYSKEDDKEYEFIFTAVHIFRKNLPGKVIDGRIMPIIAKPDTCKNVYVLPKKYWSKKYKALLW